MEIIPIADDASETIRAEDSLPPIDTFDSGPKPLGVELLEDRVLLATDAAPAAAAMPADVEAPQAPAAHVAQPYAPHELTHAASEQVEVSEEGDAPAGGSQTSAGTHGDPIVTVTGLTTHRDEPHAELVEQTTERKENIELRVEENVERRFGEEKGSAAATIEPEGAQSPQDREAAKQLVGTAEAKVDGRGRSCGPAGEATASAVVSLMNEPNGALGDRMSQVVDDLADKLAEETSVERTLDAATADLVSAKSPAASTSQPDDGGSAILQATAEEHASTVNPSAAELNPDQVAAAFAARVPMATPGDHDSLAR